MTYRGRVRNGVVVLEPPVDLPEGVEVEVHPVTAGADGRTLYERLKDVVGIAQGLPADLAENHDHYIHGAAKRSE